MNLSGEDKQLEQKDMGVTAYTVEMRRLKPARWWRCKSSTVKA